MLITHDDFVPDPQTYRAAALAQAYGDIVAGPAVFHGMAPIGASPVSAWLERVYGLTTTYAAFRLSPEGQEEPNYVHTDRDMGGTFTAILYLNPDPPAGDGTDFLRHRATGAIQSTADTDDALMDERLAWRDREAWECWRHVEARFNRLVVFPSAYFHARAIFENWGTGTDARLIQLLFGTGTIPRV